MKIDGKKILMLALAAMIGMSVATPARADWYDGHGWHHGHVPVGWHYNHRFGYYVYRPAYIVAPPGAVVVEQPAPPPVVVTQPQPVYVTPEPPPPVGLSLGVRIH